MSQSLVKLLTSLFVHRTDAYGEQWLNKETGDSGYSKATYQNCPGGKKCENFRCEHRENLKLLPTTINHHVVGYKTIGVYQLGEGDTVKWLCLDVDKDKTLGKNLSSEELQKNAQDQARALVRQALKIGLKPAVEDSGNRGYHVWIFFNKPVQASLAQAVGYFLVNNVPVREGLHIEVFPKQISSKSLGNLVKLPLGLHLKSGRRSAFVNKNFEPIADQQAFLEKVPLHSQEELQAIVDWYHLKLYDIRRTDPTIDNSGLGRRVPLCLVRLLNEGVGDGMRDLASFKIACYMRDKGIPQDLAQVTLEAWDERNKPPMTARIIMNKVDSAYSDSYGYLPCFEPAFDMYCSSKCEMYSMKQERRG
jgi:hypothetical protein